MLRTVESLQESTDPLPVADLAASFEQVVVDVLVQRSSAVLKTMVFGNW